MTRHSGTDRPGNPRSSAPEPGEPVVHTDGPAPEGRQSKGRGPGTPDTPGNQDPPADPAALAATPPATKTPAPPPPTAPVLILSHLDGADGPGRNRRPGSVEEGPLQAALAAGGTTLPSSDPGPVTLRSAAELVDALPYLLGYRPEDCMVLVAVHDRGGLGAFGGRARLGIPDCHEDWPEAARQMARGLVQGCERRGTRPEAVLAFVYRDPKPGRTGREVRDTLRPLAQLLRTECGSLDVPVLEALCVSDGRFWSYCCPSEHCCPPDGTPMSAPGSSVLSAAMTYAGLQVRGTPREFRARLTPWETAAAQDQETALDAVAATLVPRILDETQRDRVTEETLDLAHRVRQRLAAAPPVHGLLESDQRDDELVAHDEAAFLLLGLQDRNTRDRAAEWMEGEEADPVLRLWRALARRCVGTHGVYAAAPLTLAGWVAWSLGDELEAREALAMALGVDPAYVFARLLHHACNEGMDPEPIRRCLRAERARRTAQPKTADKPGGGGTQKVMDPCPGTPAGPPLSRCPRRPESRGPGHSGPGRSGTGRGGQRQARPRGSGTARRSTGTSRPPGRRVTGRD